VVDAYTRRLFYRLGLMPEEIGYDETRALFMKNLPANVQLFNEYHALIVEQCKQFCRKKPLCTGCPLFESCSFRTIVI
jgi:endonuclease-3 related protein